LFCKDSRTLPGIKVNKGMKRPKLNENILEMQWGVRKKRAAARVQVAQEY